MRAAFSCVTRSMSAMLCVLLQYPLCYCSWQWPQRQPRLMSEKSFNIRLIIANCPRNLVVVLISVLMSFAGLADLLVFDFAGNHRKTSTMIPTRAVSRQHYAKRLV